MLWARYWFSVQNHRSVVDLTCWSSVEILYKLEINIQIDSREGVISRYNGNRRNSSTCYRWCNRAWPCFQWRATSLRCQSKLNSDNSINYSILSVIFFLVHLNRFLFVTWIRMLVKMHVMNWAENLAKIVYYFVTVMSLIMFSSKKHSKQQSANLIDWTLSLTMPRSWMISFGSLRSMWIWYGKSAEHIILRSHNMIFDEYFVFPLLERDNTRYASSSSVLGEGQGRSWWCCNQYRVSSELPTPNLNSNLLCK